MKYKCVTLGCKLNYYESCGLDEALAARGLVPVGDGGPADVVLVNSCAVTSRAGMQSRQRLRKEIRENPGALVLITGCYAQYDPAGCAAIEGVAAVVGNPGKAAIPAWVAAHAGRPPREPAIFGLDGSLPVTALRAAAFRGRSRALLKIQDGCNSFCSYCIIPYLRQRSRSLSPDVVLEEAGKLAAAGYGELVLTGVHLGQYGLDLRPATDLTALLRRLDRLPALSRLRLGSLQPPEITAGIIDLLVDENSCVCEHLHFSLQSLVDRVLEAMGRQYRQRQVIALVEAIKRRHPRVTLGADLIVGFPAAGRDDFRDTCRLLADLPLDYLHVFPYSPRPGTKAAGWPAAAGDGEIRERVAAIQELGAAMRERCYAANVGVEHEVLLEKPVAAAGKEPVWTGHSRNYLQVRVALSSPEARVLRAGDCCRVTTTGAEPGRWLRAKK